MEKSLFIKKLLQAATEAGIEAAEVYAAANDSFRAMSHDGEVSDYSVASRSGLSLRGLGLGLGLRLGQRLGLWGLGLRGGLGGGGVLQHDEG